MSDQTVKEISVAKVTKIYFYYLFARKALITYYIPSAKFFIGNFFANERKHP
jgi:hypothetical protein